MWYFEEGVVVLWRGWCGSLKGLCGTWKRVARFFEEGGVVHSRGWCGTLKRVLWYFQEVGVVWYFTYINFSVNIRFFNSGKTNLTRYFFLHFFNACFHIFISPGVNLLLQI